MNMVKIEINDQIIEAREGQMLIDVADDAGINIPRFCYHKKLSVAANCRMCLVEVAGAPKALPACATPITDGMKVMTKSPKALAAQKSVMEFLLINHPLDCPICDQGGECELQDVSMLYGQDVGRFSEGKRIIGEKDIGPLVQTDMTRCIHCTRCVRFGKEIAGVMELGATGRGEHMEIGTYVAKAMVSELSGNIIDLCPVGALTSKPYRYTARAWELQAVPGIAVHDGLGSHTYVHHKQGVVKRVVPREYEPINETWLSDRDRFSYTALNHQRLTQPMHRVNGEWQPTDWETALGEVAALLKGQLTQQAQSVAALVSPTATAEEMFLLRQLLAHYGCDRIEHRLHQQDFATDAAGVMPYLPMPIEQVEKVSAALLIGSHLRHEQPLLNQRLRKASLARAAIMVINPIDYDMSYRLSAKAIVAQAAMVDSVAAVAKALSQGVDLTAEERALIADVTVTEVAQTMADKLLAAKGDKLIVLGQLAQSHAHFSRLTQLASLIAKLASATLAWLPEAGNSLAANLLALQPQHAENQLNKILTDGSVQNWILWNVEPSKDCLLPISAVTGRVVSFSCFDTPELRAVSDWLLPITAFAESAGSYVNANGMWQFSPVALKSPGDSKPGWKVVRVLANLMEVDGFDYVSLDQVSVAAQQTAKTVAPLSHIALMAVKTTLAPLAGKQRVAELPLYASDFYVRQAPPLQAHMHAGQAVLRMHPQEITSEQVMVTLADGRQLSFPVVADQRIALGNVVAPMGVMAGLPADVLQITA